MEKHIVKILGTEYITHNVKRFRISKPDAYKFKPGQATDISIIVPGRKELRGPFTFTSLNDWDTLEFTIKIYADHHGLTNELGKLKAGDELVLHDVFGAINYKGEGVFISGGAGVTPFIAIFRQLQKDKKLGNNKLIFSNKTSKDIILKDEFKKMLGDNFINTITDEQTEHYDNGEIDAGYLKEKINDFSQYFYICGPKPMIKNIKGMLQELGAYKEKLVLDEF